MPVNRPRPPHTPAIQRSVRLRRKVLTAETKGGEEFVLAVFNSRSFARVNSSSVKAPRARSSSNLLRSSLSVITLSVMRGVVGGGAILAPGILTRRFVLHFLAMMLNHTPRSGPQ